MPYNSGQRSAVAVADGVTRVIRQYARVIPSTMAITPDLELLEAGVDSMTLVEIIAGLEVEFDCTFPDGMLILDIFRTPASIASTVIGLMSGAS